jgi:hypothetical protein
VGGEAERVVSEELTVANAPSTKLEMRWAPSRCDHPTASHFPTKKRELELQPTLQGGIRLPQLPVEEFQQRANFISASTAERGARM